MYPAPIQNLIHLFSKLPSIGPRQAARLVFHLLNESPENLENLGGAIANLKSRIDVCPVCFKTAETGGEKKIICKICSDANRERHIIAVVEKESDLVALEKTRKYGGLYHILNGVISPLDGKGPEKIRVKELLWRVKNSEPKIKEVILATNPTTEGDATAIYVERTLAPFGVKISRLGRGLSVGAELEYADETTLNNALQNRK